MHYSTVNESQKRKNEYYLEIKNYFNTHVRSTYLYIYTY